jgi:hypothetical protein
VLWGGCRTPQGATFKPLISRRARGQFPSLRRILFEISPFPVVNHLGPFDNVLVINDNYLWTNDSWRNKNAGLDHIEMKC